MIDETTPPPGQPESPVAPVVRQLDRTIDFLDLIGARQSSWPRPAG
ncbi:hypothetical protein [Streptomyces sp. NBC_00443]